MDILNMKASFPSLSLLLFTQLFFSQTPLTCSFSFNFPSFTTNSKEIITQGVASISDDGSIELIPTLGKPIYKVGRVLYSQAIPVWDSSGNIFNFSTHFSFTLSPLNSSMSDSGDGIVFFLSPYPSIIPATTGGEYFGVFNMSTVPNTVAVEFDSYKNTILDDISEHHIGIDIEKAISVANTDLNFTMTNGYKSDAWINYESNTQMLSVFFSYPELKKSWSLYSQVDLKKYLTQEVAVGFGAATGGSFQRTTLLSWNFTSSFNPYFLSSVSPPPVPAEGSSTRGKKTKNVVPIAVSVTILVLICFLVLCVCCRKRINSYIKLIKPGAHSGPIQFTYDELVTATTNFSKEIGRGASGEIFEGTITNPNTNGCKLFKKKIKVAVKRITGTKLLRSPAYQSELDILNQLSHINLVQLVGYYNEDNCLLLVYEYMSNQSLDHHLYRDKNELKWPERYKIATGLATALSYLHEQYNQCIIYRDVKPSNVMLDSEFNAKLGDFGIAKLVDHGDIIQTAITTGTHGYIAPEYYATGKASKESDIFSFGIVALEIACGTKPVANDSSLEKKVRENLEWNDLLAVADVRLNGEFNSAEMERLLTVGLSCCNNDPKLRMSMQKVVSILKFDCDLAGAIIDHDKDEDIMSDA